MLQSILLLGRGFAQEAIMHTVFIDSDTGFNSLTHDMAVTDLTVGGIHQPIALVTGRKPFVVINPQSSQTLYSGDVLNQAGEPLTSWTYAVAAVEVGSTPIAVLTALKPAAAAGGAGGGHVFVVMDLTDPSNPRAMGTLDLPGYASSWTRSS
jgi:hypothetical protein